MFRNISVIGLGKLGYPMAQFLSSSGAKINCYDKDHALINELKKNNVRIAIVSSTTQDDLSTLFKNGLKIDPNSTFDLIAHGGCTENKRPSPEIYEWILEKLRIAPQSCVAIEDSLRGLRSAVNANINVLVTPSIYTKNENFEEANIVVSSLGESEEPFKVIKGKTYGNKLVNFDLLNKLINH